MASDEQMGGKSGAKWSGALTSMSTETENLNCSSRENVLVSSTLRCTEGPMMPSMNRESPAGIISFQQPLATRNLRSRPVSGNQVLQQCDGMLASPEVECVHHTCVNSVEFCERTDTNSVSDSSSFKFCFLRNRKHSLELHYTLYSDKCDVGINSTQTYSSECDVCLAVLADNKMESRLIQNDVQCRAEDSVALKASNTSGNFSETLAENNDLQVVISSLARTQGNEVNVSGNSLISSKLLCFTVPFNPTNFSVLTPRGQYGVLNCPCCTDDYSDYLFKDVFDDPNLCYDPYRMHLTWSGEDHRSFSLHHWLLESVADSTAVIVLPVLAFLWSVL